MTYVSLYECDATTARLAARGREDAAVFGEARLEAGVLLRRLQRGDAIGMPHARAMPALGARCGELRISDATVTWRILYRLDTDAVVIVEVFAKKTAATPANVLAAGRARLRVYDRVTQAEG